MVVSEIVAATMIAVCGLKKSYRIILKGERALRRTIRKPAPIIEGFQSFPRSFLRTVFRAGHNIAMRWEGRAQNAAQKARAARLKAYEARAKVVDISSDMRARAGELRDRAEDVRQRARQSANEMRKNAIEMRANAQDRAISARQKMQEARDRLVAARGRATATAARVRESLPSINRRDKTSKGLVELLDEHTDQHSVTGNVGEKDTKEKSEEPSTSGQGSVQRGLASVLEEDKNISDEGSAKKARSVQNRF